MLTWYRTGDVWAGMGGEFEVAQIRRVGRRWQAKIRDTPLEGSYRSARQAIDAVNLCHELVGL